jgi:hypothetical protein
MGSAKSAEIRMVFMTFLIRFSRDGPDSGRHHPYVYGPFLPAWGPSPLCIPPFLRHFRITPPLCPGARWLLSSMRNVINTRGDSTDSYHCASSSRNSSPFPQRYRSTLGRLRGAPGVSAVLCRGLGGGLASHGSGPTRVRSPRGDSAPPTGDPAPRRGPSPAHRADFPACGALSSRGGPSDSPTWPQTPFSEGPSCATSAQGVPPRTFLRLKRLTGVPKGCLFGITVH